MGLVNLFVLDAVFHCDGGSGPECDLGLRRARLRCAISLTLVQFTQITPEKLLV